MAFLAWDDFRVLDALRTAPGEAARALRDRRRLYVLVAEWNGERDVAPYEACLSALRERFGDAVWGDEQQQLLHRLPLDPNDVLAPGRYDFRSSWPRGAGS